ncbi:hypothetical protein RQP46_009856 [Phenoliferia psychrophenolica]
MTNLVLPTLIDSSAIDAQASRPPRSVATLSRAGLQGQMPGAFQNPLPLGASSDEKPVATAVDNEVPATSRRTSSSPPPAPLIPEADEDPSTIALINVLNASRATNRSLVEARAKADDDARARRAARAKALVDQESIRDLQIQVAELHKSNAELQKRNDELQDRDTERERQLVEFKRKVATGQRIAGEIAQKMSEDILEKANLRRRLAASQLANSAAALAKVESNRLAAEAAARSVRISRPAPVLIHLLPLNQSTATRPPSTVPSHYLPGTLARGKAPHSLHKDYYLEEGFNPDCYRSKAWLAERTHKMIGDRLVSLGRR